MTGHIYRAPNGSLMIELPVGERDVVCRKVVEGDEERYPAHFAAFRASEATPVSLSPEFVTTIEQYPQGRPKHKGVLARVKAAVTGKPKRTKAKG